MLAVIGLLLKAYAPYSATGELLGVIGAELSTISTEMKETIDKIGNQIDQFKRA